MVVMYTIRSSDHVIVRTRYAATVQSAFLCSLNGSSSRVFFFIIIIPSSSLPSSRLLAAAAALCSTLYYALCIASFVCVPVVLQLFSSFIRHRQCVPVVVTCWLYAAACSAPPSPSVLLCSDGIVQRHRG